VSTMFVLLAVPLVLLAQVDNSTLLNNQYCPACSGHECDCSWAHKSVTACLHGDGSCCYTCCCLFPPVPIPPAPGPEPPKPGPSIGCGFTDSSAVKSVQYQWASRGTVAHTGLTWQTASGGNYSLAYNSATVPGIGIPAGLWCQEGGMPMKNALANGDCPGCGGWHSTDSKSGTFMSNTKFITEATAWYASHPTYSLRACTDDIGFTANCQSTSAHLYEALTGQTPTTAGCPSCGSGPLPTTPCCLDKCK